MTVSVETLNGLERKITVTIPSEKIEEEVTARLRQLAPKAKVPGFRQGKVSFNVIRQRFSDSVRHEAVRDIMQPALFEAVKEHKLNPASPPIYEPNPIVVGEDFTFSARLEVYPEISTNELENDQIELITAEVTDNDLNAMLDNLRAQNKEWDVVTRPVAKNDKIIIDFKGFLDGVAFEGGEAKNHELILGSGAMIPSFEEGLIGLEKDKTTDIHVSFPSDYPHEALAGKDTVFQVTVKRIAEGRLPEIDTAFAEKFNIKNGDVDVFKKEIKENMARELERRVSSMNRERIFNKLLEKNTFDLPGSLVDQEIEHLKHEMYHKIFGNHHSENEKIPDFPRVLFEDKARHRVQLGLLFAEYVKKHEIIVDKARVDAMIESFSGAYEDPEELRDYYRESEERRGDLEALAMEEIVAEKILEHATTTKRVMTYDEVVNPVKNKED
jgi:trigger factor